MSVDCQVFLLDGMRTNECVVENEDGSYSVFINSSLCDDKRMKAYNHAMRHIEGNDFERYDVQEIEYEAHKKNSL